MLGSPVTSPMGIPSRRSLPPPAGPVRRWRVVIADGYCKEWAGNISGRNDHPWTVVPWRDVPGAIGEHVILSSIKEVVGGYSRRVLHTGAGHDRERRRCRKIDPDVHVDARFPGTRETCQSGREQTADHQCPQPRLCHHHRPPSVTRVKDRSTTTTSSDGWPFTI